MSNVAKAIVTATTILGVGIVSARLLNAVSACSLERKAKQDLAKHTGRTDLEVTIKPSWFGNRWSVVVTDTAGKLIHSDTFVMKNSGIYYQWTTYGAWVVLVRDTLEGEQV